MGMYDTDPPPPEEAKRRCYFCPYEATTRVGTDIPSCAPCAARARSMRDRAAELRTSFDGTAPPPITQRSVEPSAAYWRH